MQTYCQAKVLEGKEHVQIFRDRTGTPPKMETLWGLGLLMYLGAVKLAF